LGASYSTVTPPLANETELDAVPFEAVPPLPLNDPDAVKSTVVAAREDGDASKPAAAISAPANGTALRIPVIGISMS
jgi:hypothetical protein